MTGKLSDFAENEGAHRVLVLLQTRSDPNLLHPLLSKLREDPRFRLTLVSLIPPADLAGRLDDWEIFFRPAAPLTERIGQWIRRSLLARIAERIINTRSSAVRPRPTECHGNWFERESAKWRASLAARGVPPTPFIAAFSPHIIIDISGSTSNAIIIPWATGMRIPTLYIQHGLILGQLGLAWKAGEFIPFDHVAVWGDFPRNTLLEAGYPQDRVFRVGSLSFDGLAAAVDPKARAAIRHRLDIPMNATAVLFPIAAYHRYLKSGTAVIFRDDQIHKWLEIVTQALREHPELFVLVKPHPLLFSQSQDCRLAREYLQRVPNRVIWLDPTEDIWTAITAADLLVDLPGSTVTLQSLAAGRPFVAVKPDGYQETYDLFLPAGTPEARTHQELSRILGLFLAGRLQANPGARSLIESHVGPLDSGASSRLCELIHSLCNASHAKVAG